MKPDYKPQPADLEGIALPESLRPLTEAIARNVHEVWALGRVEQGWSWGEVRDDNLKKHPCLVDYDALPESEREYDRRTALNTLRFIVKMGYKIEK